MIEPAGAPGSASGSGEAPASVGAPASVDAPPSAPPEQKPIDGIALFKEVALDRLEHLLEWLLSRLKRYRARRGNWWEQG